jgi:acyl-CoA thioester hydrolase
MARGNVRDQTAQSAAHLLTLRVYYEDTDFSGRVYHASYLRFLERGRTEWLRERGFEQRGLAADTAVVFVIRHLAIDFVRPAVMDDVLTIETTIASVGAASIDFAQTILRGDERLAVASVSVVLLRAGRPARLPTDIRERLRTTPAGENLPSRFKDDVV